MCVRSKRDNIKSTEGGRRNTISVKIKYLGLTEKILRLWDTGIHVYQRNNSWTIRTERDVIEDAATRKRLVTLIVRI